jgi:hypothetical protein
MNFRRTIFLSTGIIGLGLFGLIKSYSQQLENIREMNKVMDIRRDLFHEAVEACKTVHYGNEGKFLECCDEESMRIFGNHPPGDPEAPARKQYGVVFFNAIFYNFYVEWVHRTDKTK